MWSRLKQRLVFNHCQKEWSIRRIGACGSAEWCGVFTLLLFLLKFQSMVGPKDITNRSREEPPRSHFFACPRVKWSAFAFRLPCEIESSVRNIKTRFFLIVFCCREIIFGMDELGLTLVGIDFDDPIAFTFCVCLNFRAFSGKCHSKVVAKTIIWLQKSDKKWILVESKTNSWKVYEVSNWFSRHRN